jgi:hypothetical protein
MAAYQRKSFLIDRKRTIEEYDELHGSLNDEVLIAEAEAEEAEEALLDSIEPEKYLNEERSKYINNLTESQRQREIGNGKSCCFLPPLSTLPYPHFSSWTSKRHQNSSDAHSGDVFSCHHPHQLGFHSHSSRSLLVPCLSYPTSR